MTNVPAELRRAAEFHTHLGPYLVIGLRMGRIVVRELGREPFTISIRAFTGDVPPYSCAVDGLQLATPCTTGNGGLRVDGERRMAIEARRDDRCLMVTLRPEVFRRIEADCTEANQETFACGIWEAPDDELFIVERREG